MHGERRGEALSYLANLPEPVARAMTLEFPGVAADHLVLKALTYLGQKLIGNEPTSPEEYQAIYRASKQATNLRGTRAATSASSMTRPDDAAWCGNVTELDLAAAVRTDDYRPHFFLWHNYFTHLNDPKTAGLHLEKAARIPGAPTYFGLRWRAHQPVRRTDLRGGGLSEGNHRRETRTCRWKFLAMRLKR